MSKPSAQRRTPQRGDHIVVSIPALVGLALEEREVVLEQHERVLARLRRQGFRVSLEERAPGEAA